MLLARALALAGECRSSAVLVSQRGQTVVDVSWEVAEPSPQYRQMFEGRTENGAPIEDVASVQKSLLSVLVSIARGRGLLALDDTLTSFLGEGWSQAPDSEPRISVHHVLSMTSGLDARLGRFAEPGTVWRYNSAVHARLLPLLEKVGGKPIDDLTREWLTGPLGMEHTRWVERSWADPEAPNRLALVTTARDLERLGSLILAKGEWEGRALVDAELLRECLRPSQTLNPAYGLLWWLNGQERYLTRFPGIAGEGPHFPTAPMDAVLGLGALDRHFMVAPSQDLVVVRLGDAVDPRRPAAGAFFTRRFWKLLTGAAPQGARRAG